MKKHTALLKSMDACSEAVAFADQHKSFKAAWEACQRPDWMLWLLGHINYQDEKALRLFACWCAHSTPLSDGRKVWDLLTDKRSRDAVEVAERFTVGEATNAELAAAGAAARDAAWAAAWDAAWDAAGAAAGAAAWDAAGAASWAAARAAAGAAVGDVARAAAWAAAWAAAGDAARDAAWAVAGDAARDAQSTQLRTMFPWSKVSSQLKKHQTNA